MNEFLQRRIEKHKKTLDFRNSSVRKLGDLDNLICGEVRGVHDKKPFAFFMKDGTISVSDLLDHRNSKIEFQYSLVKNVYNGKGIRNHYKECERLVAYVLLMIEKLNEDYTKKRVH